MGNSNINSHRKSAKIPWSRMAKQSGLSSLQLRQLRDQLVSKRRELLSDMTELRSEYNGCGNGDGDSNELLERASEMEGAELAATLYGSQWGELTNIDAALERMTNGTYGLCQETNKPIGAARLNAIPWAMYCIDHARTLERRRGGTGQHGAQSQREKSFSSEDSSPETVDDYEDDDE